jgi:hypothetical protein
LTATVSTVAIIVTLHLLLHLAGHLGLHAVYISSPAFYHEPNPVEAESEATTFAVDDMLECGCQRQVLGVGKLSLSE